MSTQIKIKRKTGTDVSGSLIHGELGTTQNFLWYGNQAGSAIRVARYSEIPTNFGVTSVGISMPTGFSVGSSPITSTGTIAISFASGYSLPTTAKQGNWDTAYGWGNHSGKYRLIGWVPAWGDISGTTPTWNQDTTGSAAKLGGVAANLYATKSWVATQSYLTATSLSGYALESWVTNKGYITSSGSITGNAATATNSAQLGGTVASSYALKTYVTGRGYITASDSITGNAATATKLATERAIKIGSQTFDFDGTAPLTYTISGIGAIEQGTDINMESKTIYNINYIASNYELDTSIRFTTNDMYFTTKGQAVFRVNGTDNSTPKVEFSVPVTGITHTMVGAAAASHGNHVPTIQTASNKIFLRNDNTWQTITPANIGAATSGHGHDPSSITLATAQMIGRISGGTGGAESLSQAQVRTFLGLGTMAYASTASYLGKTATAADSDKLGGTVASSYALQSYVTSRGYITGSGSITGNAATATKLANIDTSFSGTYPMVVNVSGVLYSNANVTFNGTSNAITATEFIGALTGTASGNLTSSSSLAAAKLTGNIHTDRLPYATKDNKGAVRIEVVGTTLTIHTS